MARNRYVASIHDGSMVCPDDDCGVKNAPAGSDEYEAECWRCGTVLESENIAPGDIIEVSTIDEKGDGTIVTKATSGLVVFVTEPVEQAEFYVEVTDVDRNCAYGTPTEIPSEPDASESQRAKPRRLGSRDNFWEST